jgi:SAM-dependent methyltransferase
MSRRVKQLALRAASAVGLEGQARAFWRLLKSKPAPVVPGMAPDDPAYAGRLQSEHSHFDDNVNVHDLPGIFHYWSNKYLRPKVLPFGFDHPDSFFANGIGDVLRGSTNPSPVILSIGAGNCDTEVRVARRLLEMGFSTFRIECLELSKPMLERGRHFAEEEGVQRHIETIQADFNTWVASRSYDVVMANHSLHHVSRLEHLFGQVKDSLEAGGTFVVSDMIGRNGHMRWPEALDIVNHFWRELPRDKRYNALLRRQEDEFVNWDCSGDGFEGIRAQDILPLMLERFHFRSFLGFSNLVDPFVDRGFGHNYDPASQDDCAIIDRIESRDELEIRAGRIKPTHMFAILTKEKAGQVQSLDHLTPEFCVRYPG